MPSSSRKSKNSHKKKSSKKSSRRKTSKSSARTSMLKTIESESFRDSLRKAISEGMLENAFDLDEVAEMEEKRISEIKPKLLKDLRTIEKALIKNKNGGFILFGDSHHGDLAFDFIEKIYPNLNASLKNILKNAHYFSENDYQMNDIMKSGYGKKFVGLDDDVAVDPNNFDELKRNHQANQTWPEIILKNKTNKGINIISVGRSHLYSVKAKKGDSRLQRVEPFQEILKKATQKPVTVFTMNNDLDLIFDNYKEYAKTHQLDEVIDDTKIRSIFAF